MKKIPATAFKKGDPRASIAGKRGRESQEAAKRMVSGLAPYTGTVLDVMDAAGLTGESWGPWRAFLKAIFALPVTVADLEVYRRHTARETPPAAPVAEAWMPVGRRGGKSRVAALVAAYLAVRFDGSRLAPGERAVIAILAADRRQARQVLGYLNGLFDLPDLLPFWFRTLRESIELQSGVNLEVHTASYRTTRGYTLLGVIADEISFWRTEDGSANPDSEVLAALRPGMATVPDSLLLAMSSPYAARGELFKAHERYFGHDDPRVLVWNADTRSMNPSIPTHVIEQAFLDDPVAAASEYGQDGHVQFRRDVEQFLDAEAVRAATVPGRRELPPSPGTRYLSFVDPSGGSQDSFTLAIAHAERETVVLDAVREVRPPFSPDSVVADFCALLRTYGCVAVVGDRYGGEWPREVFRKHGITYRPSERTKSDIYRELPALVNAGRCALLDVPVLRAQLIGLERRVARGGRDSIDHAPGGRDDVANAAAGALVLSAAKRPARRRSPGGGSFSSMEI
jgi:hypothetical protein